MEFYRVIRSKYLNGPLNLVEIKKEEAGFLFRIWESDMFFEVRIFNSDGELKRVVSPKKLSKNFWKENSNGLPDFNDIYLNQDNLENKNAWDKVQMEDPDV